MRSVRVTLNEHDAQLLARALRDHAHAVRFAGHVLRRDLDEHVTDDELGGQRFLDAGHAALDADAAQLEVLADRVEERLLAC